MVLRPRSDAACRKQIAANRLHNIPEWVRSALKLAEQALEVVQFDLGAMPFAATPAKFVQYFASSLPQCLVGQLYFVTRAKVATTSALPAKGISLSLTHGTEAPTFTLLPLAQLLREVFEQCFHALLQMVEGFSLRGHRFTG